MSQAVHHVLVVEDDEDIRASLMDVLSDNGYQPIGARDGRDALAKLTHTRPCLILLDLMMPDMDGPAFREEQLRDPALSEIPVVVISAYRDIVESAKDMNVARLLKKPLDLAELLSVLDEHCPL